MASTAQRFILCIFLAWSLHGSANLVEAAGKLHRTVYMNTRALILVLLSIEPESDF